MTEAVLTPLEAHVMAYYIATQAGALTIAPRWYPYGELVMILTDKIQVATRKFGIKVSGQSKAAATAFVDHIIDKGGWASQQNKFGGSMHQWQIDIFRAELKAMQDSDPVIRQAAAGDATYWENAFAGLN